MARENGGSDNGSAKLCIPHRRLAVCRSGTLAIRSLDRASASAVEKPATMVAMCRCNPSSSRASSIAPLSSPRRDTLMWSCAAKRAGVISPSHSGCPVRTTPMKRSRNNPWVSSSGLAAWPTTPVSRSTVPSRSAALSLSGLCMKRRRMPGACSATRAISAAPKFSTKPSLVRNVNVRTKCMRSGCSAGRSIASASCTS
ncbi:hypothetical protein D3C76_1331380 [compost metagenome]